MSPPTSVHTLLLLGKGTESSNRHRPVRSLQAGRCRFQAALSRGGETPPERSALVLKVRVLGGSSLSERGPSVSMVIMRIMHVLMEELLRQDSKGWSPMFENLPAKSVWVCGYVPLFLALNGIAP
jgi:hypothetical protein